MLDLNPLWWGLPKGASDFTFTPVMCPSFRYSKPSTTIQNMDTEIKDFSPGKWEEDENTEDKPLSFGQKAVGRTSIETGEQCLDICRVKSYIAELIDIIDLRAPQSRAATEDGFLQRMAKDEATKKLIDACDAAVKYVTMSK